jgi:hypothetical protein
MTINASSDVHTLPSTASLGEFQHLWLQGIPVVIDIGGDFQCSWEPDYFIERYGAQEVTLVNCETASTQQSTVVNFLRDFDVPGKPRQILKLKVLFHHLPVYLLIVVSYRIGPRKLVTRPSSLQNISERSHRGFHSEISHM